MKGGWYTLITVLVAMFTVVTAGDTEIRPIPTKCPPLNNPNYTVHIAHETDCTKFYICNWGNKIESVCPVMNQKGDRLHFNPLLQVCDWPNNAGCKNGGGNKPVTSPPTRPPTNPPTNPPTKPPTNSPTKPPTNPPNNSTTRPTTERPAVSDEDVDNDDDIDIDVACPMEDTVRVTYSHPCSCEKYYLCKKGDLVLKKCSGGQHWNEDKEKCDKPAHANCIKKKTLNWYYN